MNNFCQVILFGEKITSKVNDIMGSGCMWEKAGATTEGGALTWSLLSGIMNAVTLVHSDADAPSGIVNTGALALSDADAHHAPLHPRSLGRS